MFDHDIYYGRCGFPKHLNMLISNLHYPMLKIAPCATPLMAYRKGQCAPGSAHMGTNTHKACLDMMRIPLHQKPMHASCWKLRAIAGLANGSLVDTAKDRRLNVSRQCNSNATRMRRKVGNLF